VFGEKFQVPITTSKDSDKNIERYGGENGWIRKYFLVLTENSYLLSVRWKQSKWSRLIIKDFFNVDSRLFREETICCTTVKQVDDKIMERMCLECSICVIFFNSSLIVSMIAFILRSW